jgi:hypothetical protein
MTLVVPAGPAAYDHDRLSNLRDTSREGQSYARPINWRWAASDDGDQN